MKKLLMTLVACFAVFAAQAYDALYLRGSITGSSWPALPAYQFSTSDGVTYTLTLTTLSGQFKIADANWGTHNYGYNGGAISLDTEYTLTSGGGNISIVGGATWNNVTLTFNLNTKKLKVTGSATANDYSCVYLVGNINDTEWDENITNYPLNPQSGSSTTFVGSYSFTGVSYFKMKAGTLVYGTGGADINVVAGTPYTASQDGNAFVLGKGDYTFKFVLEKNAATGVLTVEGEGEEVPENYDSWYVNVLGPYNSWQDNGVNPVNGISTTTNQAIGTQGFKIKVWNGTSDTYYIGDVPSIPTKQWVQLYEDVYEGQPIQIDGATSNSVYTVKFNCETNQVYVELTSGGTVEPEEPEYPEYMYLIGDKVNGQTWNITNPIEMSNEGDGLYSIENVKIEAPDAVATADDENASYGYFAFTTVKVTDPSDWTTVNANRYGPAVNDTEIIGVLGNEAEVGIQKNGSDGTAYKINPGIYTITIDLNEGLLVMEMTEEIEIEPEPTPDLGDEAKVTFNFQSIQNDASYTPDAVESNWTAVGTNGNKQYILTDKQSESQGVTIDWTNPSGSNVPSYYQSTTVGNFVYFYTGNQMKISAPEGYKLSTVVIGNSTSYTNIEKMALGDGQEGSMVLSQKSKNQTWTAPETGDITELVIVGEGPNQISTIDVNVVKMEEEVTYEFVGQVLTKEMTLEGNVLTLEDNFVPQAFNIQKKVNGVTKVTYQALSQTDAANQIINPGEYDGTDNNGFDWVISAAIVPVSGGDLIVTFDLETLKLNVEKVVPPVDYIYFNTPINVETSKTVPGTVDVPISLKANTTFEYQGFQFNITLPEDVSITNAVSTLVGDGAISYNKTDEATNTYTVLAYFTDKTSEVDNIATLTLSAAYNADTQYPVEKAAVEIADSSVIFSTPQGQDKEDVNGFKGEMNIDLAYVAADGIVFGNDASLMEPSFTKEDGPVSTVTAGEGLELSVSLTPEDTDDSVEDIEWSYSIEGVTATVDAEGNLQISTAGVEVEELTTVTVTAKIGDVEETYTFTVKPVRLGDANDNGKVTVADVVTTANVVATLVAGMPITSASAETFCFPNANVITTEVGGKQEINSQDVTGIVNIVFGLAPDAQRNAKRMAGFFETNDELVAANFKVTPNREMNIGVSLDNSRNYSALQASVIIPEGMKVVGVTKGARAAGHELVYRIGDGKVGVMLYSLSNTTFVESDEALFNLIVVANEDCDDIRFENIQASDASSNGYGLTYDGGRNLTGTTGIDGIGIDEEGVRYYDMNGIEIPRPDKGIYIRVENGQAVKVVK